LSGKPREMKHFESVSVGYTSGTMQFYSAYTLCIASDIPLLELPAAEGPADVTIQLMPAAPNEVRSIEWGDGPAGETRFRFPEVGEFVLKGGRQVIVTPDPRAALDLLRLYIQGMILAAVLYQRNYFVLHSSVVNVGGNAIAFIGHVGAGKSSLAAAFHSAGYGMVADDNAAISLGDGRLHVLPAFPALKVYPAIAASLGYDSGAMVKLHHSQVKRAQPVVDGFSSKSLPLRCVFALDREIPPGIQKLTPVEAITEMIRHSVPTRWGVSGDAQHLNSCAQLAKALPVYRIRTFSELCEIPQIVRQIEEHLGATFDISATRTAEERDNAA
jgi:hypothetical protein